MVNSITLPIQKLHLKTKFPESTIIKNPSLLIWKAKIKPTSLSSEYNVTIIYDGKTLPDVWISGKNIKMMDDKDFPHKYEICEEQNRVRICLYRPSANEWDNCMFISETIVPWSVEWLYHYEIWLATGEWCGGGEHPNMK